MRKYRLIKFESQNQKEVGMKFKFVKPTYVHSLKQPECKLYLNHADYDGIKMRKTIFLDVLGNSLKFYMWQQSVIAFEYEETPFSFK